MFDRWYHVDEIFLWVTYDRVKETLKALLFCFLFRDLKNVYYHLSSQRKLVITSFHTKISFKHHLIKKIFFKDQKQNFTSFSFHLIQTSMIMKYQINFSDWITVHQTRSSWDPFTTKTKDEWIGKERLNLTLKVSIISYPAMKIWLFYGPR